jgi:alpha-galactosidase
VVSLYIQTGGGGSAPGEGGPCLYYKSLGHIGGGNDTDSVFSYTGSSWSYSANRGTGDWANDVHYTTNNGDYATLSFTGIGATYITETNSDQGNVTAYVDGSQTATVSCTTSSRASQQGVYCVSGLSNGAHTLKLVKSSGTYMIVDAYNVINFLNGANDTSSMVSYLGSSWSYSANRGDGDFSNDVHYTTHVGDYATFTWTGTGVTYVTETAGNEGNVTVYVDGVQKGTVSCINTYGTNLAPQQAVYSIFGLSSGTHTLKLVMASGAYMIVDAFNYW